MYTSYIKLQFYMFQKRIKYKLQRLSIKKNEKNSLLQYYVIL